MPRFKVVWPELVAATAPPNTPEASNLFRQTTDLQPTGKRFSGLRGEYASPLPSRNPEAPVTARPTRSMPASCVWGSVTIR